MTPKPNNLRFLLVQYDISWENKKANFQKIEEMIDQEHRSCDLIILPEMFATGFTNNAKKFSESKDGVTSKWMLKLAEKTNAVILGGIIAVANKHFYNRMLIVHPNGAIEHYDKHHLFSYSNETEYYTAGQQQMSIVLQNWKLRLSICYDMRFPEWLRNDDGYDVLINIANWPVSRIRQWSTLLQARAIENQAFVLGVNRVGRDGNKLEYNGQSCAINFDGTYLKLLECVPAMAYVELDLNELKNYRKRFPFLNDKDQFIIQLDN